MLVQRSAELWSWQDNIVAEITRAAKAKQARPKPRLSRWYCQRERGLKLLALRWRHINSAELQLVPIDRARHGHMVTGMFGDFILVVDGVNLFV